MTDIEIIDLYFSRSEAAIEETRKKYGAYIRTIIMNILHCAEDTEEVVNDVYLATWNSLPPNRPNVLKHYLARIARNLSFKRYEYLLADKRSRYTQVVLSELDECIPDNYRDPMEAVIAKEIGECINRFLSSLEKEDCALFVSRYYYMLTIDELAEKYRRKPRKVKYRLHKLRLSLKEYLRKEDMFYES